MYVDHWLHALPSKKGTYERITKCQFRLSSCWGPFKAASQGLQTRDGFTMESPRNMDEGRGAEQDRGPSAYRPVLSPASGGSGWRWIWSGRCSCPQTGGYSCPRCWTAFCLEAVKSSSIIFASESLEATLSGRLCCSYLLPPKPPPSHPRQAREEECTCSKPWEGGDRTLTPRF